MKLLFKEISQLEPDCVVFNWECCSGYCNQTFSEGAEKVMKLLGFIIKAKHMAMFSDFSLKALITQWDDKTLGSNPFHKMASEFGETAILKFDPEVLKESPSAQLQSVGDLSEGGKCNVHCLGGTIVYSVNMKNTDHNHYKLQILTVAENTPFDGPEWVVTLAGEKAKGTAGHVLLTYPNGGKLLSSMTHWSELVKVDTSEQKLYEMAEKQYGVAEVECMKQEMALMQ